MKSNLYWDKRRVERYSESEKRATEYILKIHKIYEQANRNIQREIESVYQNYSKDTGIDVQKLKELLTKSETKKCFEELKKLGLNKYVKDNYKSRINRLERLQLELYKKIKDISSKEQRKHTELYQDTIKNGYYKAIYDTQIGTGYDFNFSEIDNNMIKSLMNEKWQGSNYSERIWKNTDVLASQVSDIVGGALLSGQGIEKTARQIRERFGVAKYYASRLARTEMNYFNNQADAMAYEEMGIDKYVYVTILDSRTSEICQSLDNKVFNYKDMEIGVNYPPMHPNCRSTTRGYLGEEAEKLLKRKAKNPITGEYEIIDNVGYKDWLKGINTLKNTPKSSIINIHIDEMTPCLYKKETNEYIDTFFKKMTNKEDLKELTKDWKFNWNKEDNVYGLYTKDNKNRLQGLISYKVQKENQAVYIKLLENNPDNIQNKTYTGVGGHMIAQACKISFNHKYNGFVYLDAKTNLINHYKKYGAKQFAKSQRMIFDENASKKLVEEYYGKKKRH